MDEIENNIINKKVYILDNNTITDLTNRVLVLENELKTMKADLESFNKKSDETIIPQMMDRETSVSRKRTCCQDCCCFGSTHTPAYKNTNNSDSFCCCFCISSPENGNTNYNQGCCDGCDCSDCSDGCDCSD